MTHESAYISIGSEKLHYLRWGNGSKLLLAFHGYGNDASVFWPFREHLSEAYTILSFDLPHHGKSNWEENMLLKKEGLVALVETLKESYKVDKVSLLGYSMGGRVCMTIVESLPASIDKVALIATDGLMINRLYYFCTRTWAGKKLFRHVLEKPERYFKLIDWLQKTNRLDPSRYRFVMQHLQSVESRRFLWQVWPAMSDLIPNPSKLKRIIRKYRLPVSIFMGAHDRVMPPSLAAKFKQGLDTVQVYILDKGHRVFDDNNARQIAERLL